ncbi:U-box domain-containing protein 4 [Vitis vinifera]|uniref:RING-type E3 ubiquitin transferase n=1 Tax=Vitis vinifera TaxID=29760 RepID=A0A438FCN9_VITVI|nr:U-box domain-containing protein 4 [Vitis vinifera]
MMVDVMEVVVINKLPSVLQIELSISKIRTSGLEIFQQLKSSHQCLPDELSSASLETCIQKVKHMGYEQTSTILQEAIRNQVQGAGSSSESLMKLADCLSLRSNQELLIEAVALEKLKENAEQAEKTEEAEYIDQMITLATQMHDRFIITKQSQSCNPIPIPADFCCPLSLELMTDPVIVASGQTYERAFIRKWLDLGLTVCPKTRQTLAHTNLIPNYTVKALIANWCESNNVKLPDPVKSLNLNQSSPLLAHAEPGAPRDAHNVPHSRASQPMSPESTRFTGSPGNNLVSSGGIHREGTSPSHPRSRSEGSLSGVAGNGHGSDIEDRSMDSVGQPSTLPSRKESSNSTGADANLCRTASASTLPCNANSSEGTLGADIGVYSSDVSGEMTPEPQAAAANLTTPQREPDFPLRLETRARSQAMWRRPSERFVPRIVSSPTTETRADLSGVEAQVQRLVEDLKSESVETQREATSELRLLAKHNMDNRIVIANCNRTFDSCPADREPEAKENSAATLFSLSVIEDNKAAIGRSGAIAPLVELLGNGTPRGKKDAATALFNLSIFHENKTRIVQAGAVRHLVELMDPAAGMVDKAVAVLANLATITEGRHAIDQAGGIPVLVEVVELGSARGKENAAAALLQLCSNSSRSCIKVLQEGAVPPLVALSQSGTPRAKEKAQALLNCFRSRHAGRG